MADGVFFHYYRVDHGCYSVKIERNTSEQLFYRISHTRSAPPKNTPSTGHSPPGTFLLIRIIFLANRVFLSAGTFIFRELATIYLSNYSLSNTTLHQLTHLRIYLFKAETL